MGMNKRKVKYGQKARENSMSLIDKLFTKHHDHPKGELGHKATAPERPVPAPAKPPSPMQETKPPATAQPDIERLIEEFSQIESVLTDDDPGAAPAHETRLMLPLVDLLKVLPHTCRALDRADPGPDQEVQVVIHDLYEQLARGKVSARLIDLLTDVPECYLAPDFADHLENMITLPLPLLVRHIPQDQLEQQPRQDREPGIESLPDIFSQQDHAEPQPAAPESMPQTPPAEVSAPVPAPAPEETAGVVGEHPEQQPAAATYRIPVEKPVQDPTPAGPPLPADIPMPEILLHGIDLNRAPVRALGKALPGVGTGLAERIVGARPFASLYDLGRVPGIGPRAFRRITGHARPAGKDAVARLLTILGSSDAVRPLPLDVAQRIAAMRGVRGCIISHCEGHLLAAAWRKPPAETVSAIVPQVLKSMKRHMDDLSLKNASSLAVFTDPYPLCLVQAEDLVVTLCLSRSAFSMRRLEFFEALTWELVRRLHAHSTARNSGDVAATAAPIRPEG